MVNINSSLAGIGDWPILYALSTEIRQCYSLRADLNTLLDSLRGLKNSGFLDIWRCVPVKVDRSFGGTFSLRRHCHRGIQERKHQEAGSMLAVSVSCLAYFSTQKMLPMCFSEKSIDFRPSTRSYVPEDRILRNNRREKLISYICGDVPAAFCDIVYAVHVIDACLQWRVFTFSKRTLYMREFYAPFIRQVVYDVAICTLSVTQIRYCSLVRVLSTARQCPRHYTFTSAGISREV
jgi:hypothetical protein